MNTRIPEGSVFQPYLWARTANEKRPSSIAMAALAGARFFCRMNVPITPDKDESELIAQAVHAHFSHWRGCAGPWGQISGYTYHRSPTERWQVSVDGQIASKGA